MSARAGDAMAWLVTAALTLAVLTDAINATILGVARAHVMGAARATPDEIAWVDLGFLMARITLLPPAAWIVDRLGERRALVWAQGLVVAASVLCALTVRLEPFVAARIVQGGAGAVLLVAAQTRLLRLLPRACQPLAQAIYAMGVLVAPNALAPLVQGWLADGWSWSWAFWLELPLGLVSLLLLLAWDTSPPAPRPDLRPLDWPGLLLLAAAAAPLTWVLVEGPRWSWLDEPRVVLAGGLGLLALAAFAAWRLVGRPRGGLCDVGVLAEPRFALAFMVSLVAGFALAGSAFLLPAMALRVLGLPPAETGMLLAPAGLFMLAGLVLGGLLLQARDLEPLLLVPAGIALMMTAMWLLSQAGPQSGPGDLGTALLARGLGMGLLFLALTMVAFGTLPPQRMASAVALFALGRQAGGLLGVSFLSTFLDRQGAWARLALIEHVDPASLPFIGRQEAVAAALAGRGLEPGLAAEGAATVLLHTMQHQITALSFDAAFLTLLLVFVLAAPLILAFRIVQKRTGWLAAAAR